jgi:hypothetical protein
MHSLFLSKDPVNKPLQFPQQGVYGESCLFTRPSIKKFIPSLIGPRKGVSVHVPQKWGTYLAYLSRSPIKEPSIHVPLIELPRREMLHA